MSARKRQLAAKAGKHPDAQIIAWHRSYLDVQAKNAQAKAELDALRLKVFGKSKWPDLAEAYRAYMTAASACHGRYDELKKAAHTLAPVYLKVGNENLREGHKIAKRRREVERRTGILTLARRHNIYCEMAVRLHNKISDAKPRTLTGAAVQLRHLVDPSLGLDCGFSGEDTQTLARILQLVERAIGAETKDLGPARHRNARGAA